MLSRKEQKKKTKFVEMWNCVNTELIPFFARTWNLKNEKAKLKNSVEQEAIWISSEAFEGYSRCRISYKNCVLAAKAEI